MQKKDKLMAELNLQMEEMEEKKEQLEGQIYLLDSKSMPSAVMPEKSVNFTRIRSGKNAPDTEPIVVHQKLRFLDEDLGRLASLYEIQWNELDMFESFLKHSPIRAGHLRTERTLHHARAPQPHRKIHRTRDGQ